MKNLKTFSLAIAMLISFLTFGQDSSVSEQANQKTITGIVSDAFGPIIGANVIVKGTTRGVATNVDGRYTIKAKIGETLVFSYIDMIDQSVKVSSSNVINVKLVQSATNLDEVVIKGAVGLSKKKTKITYSQELVKANQLTQAANANWKGKNIVDEKALPVSNGNPLVGKVSGLQVNTTNAPNSSTRIVIRGPRSLTTPNNAVIVIDGEISTSEELNKLAPSEIEKVNVIKGSESVALYGSRGSNGAIIVHTKKSNDEENETPIVPITPKVEMVQEEYESFVENQFESPKSAPLSTFSIDVDNASYTNVRRFINAGQKVPKDAVRVEEMMNFFKYNYPHPKNEHPFSINTEYSDCPWNTQNKLVRIGLQGKNIESNNLPASNLVFLIDVSGSMSDENKLPLLKQSLKVLINQLRKEDKISMVVYAGAAGIVLPPTSGDKKMTIIDALDKLESGGSTAGGAGIQLAYKIAEENFIKGGNNRVILATDGDFNVGASSDSDMQTLIEEKRKSGVFLTCLGYGMGNYKDSKLETLADKGNGNYAYIDNMQEANRFLGKEFKGSMFAIAKDVKIQIEFNPTHVQAYRLIGYENRKLRPEDFKNDAIDAGELGSGHTVTALYEIIPRNTKSTLYVEPSDLKYTIIAEPDVKNYNPELATIKFRYKKPDGDKSTEMVAIIPNQAESLPNASVDFKFCSAVAWMGLTLRDSKLIVNKSQDDILALATEGMSNDSEGYRAEFIRLIENVRLNN
jgi:Ca-activated chloride channel homolog